MADAAVPGPVPPQNRTRRFILGGLLTAAGVAVALALIFTVGGVGHKKSKSSSDSTSVTTASDGTNTGTGLSDVIGALKGGLVAPAPTTSTTPKTPGSTPTSAGTPTGGISLAPAPSAVKAAAPTFEIGNGLTTTLGQKGLLNITGLGNKMLGNDVCMVYGPDDLTSAITTGTCGTVRAEQPLPPSTLKAEQDRSPSPLP